MLVTAVEARPLRSLAQARIELGPGIVSLVGPNGVGKTNFLEALYFALTGRSFRTADRRDLIPFGGSFARAEATVRDEDGIERHLLASVSRTEGRRHLLDGSPADPATLARSRPPVAVFSPDRLALIKGPPAERRAHLDGFVAARWPIRAELRQRFGQALAQRNALVARLAAGHGAPAQLDVWDATLAEAAAALVAARAEAVAELAGPFAEAAAELGLEGGAEIEYAPARRGLGGRDLRRPGRAARGRPAPRPDVLGPPPRRAQDRRRGPLAAPLRLAGPAALRALGAALRRARRPARGPPGGAAAAPRRRDERARPRPPRAAGRAPRGAAARR